MTDAHINPDRAQFDAFKALDRDHPVEMLNLVRFRERAEYPSDHPLAGDTLTGAEAYAHYGRETAPILERIGGSILWRGRFESVLIGPQDEAWDACFIARYPTAHAVLAMIADPDYQKAVIHRTAGVLTSRLIRTRPAEGGAAFG